VPETADLNALKPTAVWHSFVDTAIERKVDAVVLTGDVVDESNKFFEAYSALQSGIERLTITRQLRYSVKHGNTLDVTLALNGIPVATLELKNPMTAQTWRHAVTQYKNDRDPTDLIFRFKQRTLVHFAVDTDEVYMTTRLSGRNTRFLPFNRGCGTGAGNPENPDGCKTAYLWEEVLERHSFLDILARFIHLRTRRAPPAAVA
jgi:type I site-specific restriction-modification system R (restriction) subunit